MIVLRQPPYDDFAEYTIDPSTSYSVVIKDSDEDDVLYSDVIVSDSEGKIVIPWSGTYGEDEVPFDFSKYDEYYYLEIFEGSDIVVEDTITVERPYVNPNTLGTTTEEIATATYNERLARAIIDSITGGFYYRSSWMEVVGQGTDYISLWDRTYKILKAYENAKLVYDISAEVPALDGWNYLITKDRSAITKDPNYTIGEWNRSEGKPVGVNIAISDSLSMFDTADSGNTIALKPDVVFKQGADYIFKLETGYKTIPSDIKDATLMLIDDLTCGKLDYFKKSIVSYSTDQFKIQMDKRAFDGTGNILVDKILEKYTTNVKTPGVL